MADSIEEEDRDREERELTDKIARLEEAVGKLMVERDHRLLVQIGIVDALKSGRCQCNGSGVNYGNDEFHLDSCPEMMAKLCEGYCKRIKELGALVKKLDDQQMYHGPIELRDRCAELEGLLLMARTENRQLWDDANMWRERATIYKANTGKGEANG